MKGDRPKSTRASYAYRVRRVPRRRVETSRTRLEVGPSFGLERRGQARSATTCSRRKGARDQYAHGHTDLKQDGFDRVNRRPSVTRQEICEHVRTERDINSRPCLQSSQKGKICTHADTPTARDVTSSAVDKGQEARVNDAEEGRRKRVAAVTGHQ